jgi:hypothetical protein
MGMQCFAILSSVATLVGHLATRQKILILYLSASTLDARVIGWSSFDGTGAVETMAGDTGEPPYETGLAALRDGWRLIQMSPLIPHNSGDEFTTSYLKYEFMFEQLVEMDG